MKKNIISFETEIQILDHCFEFFEKIITEKIFFLENLKIEENVEDEILGSINSSSEPHLIQMVYKISKGTPIE